MTAANKSVLAFNLSFLFDQRQRFVAMVERLLGWMAEGKLQPPVVTTFPLCDVAEAHRAIESGKTIGKLVLVMDDDEGSDNSSSDDHDDKT
jgi:NADPH:quinone reductase-like Zn-dependent oxidoreductase